MKQTKFNNYGSFEEVYIEEVDKPEVKPNHVLIEVHASSINMLDVRVLTGNPEQVRQIIGTPKPTLNALGSDLSGVVVEVGDGVTDYKVGDDVFGQTAITQDGAFSEYVNIPSSQLCLKPKNISHSEASTVPMAAITALQALKMMDVRENSKVLIYGASGGVGTFAVQIAKALGAVVTAVCSTRNVPNAITSKADIVIDYKKENWFDQTIKYDSIFAVNGYNPLVNYLDSLINNGKLMLNTLDPRTDTEKVELEERIKEQGVELQRIYAKISSDDYKVLAKFLEEGTLKPVIDKEFPLEKVQDAFKHFMSGRTLGKIVIKVK